MWPATTLRWLRDSLEATRRAAAGVEGVLGAEDLNGCVWHTIVTAAGIRIELDSSPREQQPKGKQLREMHIESICKGGSRGT